MIAGWEWTVWLLLFLAVVPGLALVVAFRWTQRGGAGAAGPGSEVGSTPVDDEPSDDGFVPVTVEH